MSETVCAYVCAVLEASALAETARVEPELVRQFALWQTAAAQALRAGDSEVYRERDAGCAEMERAIVASLPRGPEGPPSVCLRKDQRFDVVWEAEDSTYAPLTWARRRLGLGRVTCWASKVEARAAIGDRGMFRVSDDGREWVADEE